MFACVWQPCYNALGVVGVSLKLAKFKPTTPTTSQHIATCFPNARNMLRPTMLRFVALACCDRLAGALQKAFIWRQHASAVSSQGFQVRLFCHNNYPGALT